MSAFKGTTGQASFRGCTITKGDGSKITIKQYPGGSDMASMQRTHERNVADAQLIVDAFTVRQQINCELPELVEDHTQMVKALRYILDAKGDPLKFKTKALEAMHLQQVIDNLVGMAERTLNKLNP
jgi:hypothetical protein